MIKKIRKLKEEISVTFLSTQNLIMTSCFNAEFEKITNAEEVNAYRKKLYSFRDYIGITDGYTYFDDYYIEKIAALNHKANVIENGGVETALNFAKRENTFVVILKKIKDLILGNSSEKEESK